MQAVIKVFAELAGLGKGFQVAVGGGDQTHIDLLRLHRADAADLTFLQYAQQARLGFQWQFADLVEKQGAAIGCLDQAGATGAGPGEGPFSWPNSSDSIRVSGMAAQFTEIIGALARREIVQCPRHQFLAGARLALDQHVGIGGGDLADLAEQVLHRCAVADDADVALCRVAWGAAIATARLSEGCGALLMILKDARHGLQHFVVVEGLGDVVHRAHLHGVHRRAQAGVAGHDQHRCAFGQFDQFGAGCAGQSQVADDEVETRDAVALLCFLHRAGFADLVLVAFEEAPQG